MSVGNRIKELRTKRGFMQSDMSERLKMGRANYSHIENSRVSPSGDVLDLIANILNTSTDYLLGRTDDASIKPLSKIKNPDIRAISRASDKMTDEQAEQLRKVAEALFPDAFKEE
jgi:transcriptional regulator with XRE-family HTH domain